MALKKKKITRLSKPRKAVGKKAPRKDAACGIPTGKSILKKTAKKKPRRPLKVLNLKQKKSFEIKNISTERVIEQQIEASKYYEPPQKFELPAGYDENKIVLMVRDPYWLYAYWEISNLKITEISLELGEKFQKSDLVMRVYDTSDWRFFDVNVSGYINNWYINVGRPNTSFCVDIGFLTPDGYFIAAARSNIVITPRDRMSNVVDEEWMIPDWEMMYALSGGFGRGKGSMEVREMIEKRQWIGLSSISSPVKKRPA